MVEVVTGKPTVKLVAFLDKPFDLAVASARSCYNPNLVFVDSVTEGHRERIGKSIFEAGHHTPFQHATFTFGFENISRHFTWSFLHSHPFYNSEQSSQRYNVLEEARVFLPALSGEAETVYKDAVKLAWQAYNELSKILLEDTTRVMSGIGRIKGQNEKQIAVEAEKKSVETARYVVPVAAFTSMYHTISGIELLRYQRMANSGDCPTETRLVVDAMVEEVRKIDPNFFDKTGVAQFAGESLPENSPALQSNYSEVAAFNSAFDTELGGRSSKLVSCNQDAEKMVARSVREVLAISEKQLSDDAAIELVLSPSKNPLLLDTLNSWTHAPLMRSLFHAFYVFRKKISHTADSQDQRHRMVPASRPLLSKTHSLEPDYITPDAIKANPAALKIYCGAMKSLWQAKNKLIDLGVSPEFACYLLPNATAIRFTESAPFIHLLHKFRLRTCFNAQKEIFDASMEELAQISAIHPRLAKYVGPACCVRRGLVEEKPLEGPCPEGVRWCGIKVWQNFPNVKRPF